MQEKFVFTSNGKKISAILSGHDVNALHVVIICHGLGGAKDKADYALLQNAINHRGIAAFRFDLCGHGESEGQYHECTLTQASMNVRDAATFLKQKGFSRIGFYGYSMGAYAGLVAGSKDNNFAYYVLANPASNYLWIEVFSSGLAVYNEWRKFNKKRELTKSKKRSELKFAWFRDYKKYDAHEHAKKITAPVLIIHGDNDDIVPLRKSKSLMKKFRNGKIIIMRGADHAFTNYRALIKQVELVAKFVEKQGK